MVAESRSAAEENLVTATKNWLQQQCRFTPGTHDGVPAEVRTTKVLAFYQPCAIDRADPQPVDWSEEGKPRLALYIRAYILL